MMISRLPARVRNYQFIRLVVLLVFVALSVFYNFALPLFEGSDEASHYRLTSYYADHLALPDLNHPPNHEAQQPPLYYALCAPFIRWINRSDYQQVYFANPSFGRERNINLAPTDMSLLPSGTTLAVRICRLVSTLLGAVTLLLVYATAKRLLQRDDAALLAMALTAFNPKFIHLSSVVSNDIAATCAGMLVVWLSIRVVTRNKAVSFPAVFWLGASVGIAALCKVSGLAMAIPAGIAVIWASTRQGQLSSRLSVPWVPLFVRLILLGLGFLIVAGWLFVYQYATYGNPLAWQQVAILNSYALRGAPLTSNELVQMVPRLLTTYWGGFGNAVEFPSWVDLAAGAFALVVAAGFAIALVRRSVPVATTLIGISILAGLAALVTWAVNYTATENSRLLGPIFGTVPILAAIGLLGWFRPESAVRRRAIAGLVVGSAIIAAVAPYLSLIPGYANHRLLPADQRIVRTLSDAQVNAIPRGATVSFDNGIELLYAAIDTNRIDSGAELHMSFYWRVNRPIGKMYNLVLEAFDDQGMSLLHDSRQPMGGLWPTVSWYTGDVLRDDEVIHLSAKKTAAASIVRIYVGWHRYDPPYELVRVSGGTAVSSQVAEVKIRNPHPLEQLPTHALDAVFNGQFKLDGYGLDGDTMKLYWRDIATPEQTYTVFVHGLDASGNIVAQNDAPFGYSPNLWDPGEQVIEQRNVPNLSKAIHIQIGVYSPATGERLQATHTDGSPWLDNAVIIK